MVRSVDNLSKMQYFQGALKALKRKSYDSNKESYSGERSEAKTWVASEDMRLVSDYCHQCICTYVQAI